MTIYIAGHRNPDTDSVCSAIAYAELKNKQGVKAIPVILSEINSETKFVLEKWKMSVPQLLEDATGKQLIIVDHSEVRQGPKNMDKAEILEVVDHHKIGDLQTSQPIMFISKPVGCTCTVVYDLYMEEGETPSKEVKALILSAILSDTWAFKSVITTQHDKEVAEKLASDLGLDIEEYGMSLFKAKIDFHDKTAEQILNTDTKKYDFKKGKAHIGVYELIAGTDELLKRKQEIIDYMKEMHKTIETIVFAIIDISKCETHILVVSKFEKEISHALKADVEDHYEKLPCLMSRKKQIVPVLEKIMN